MIDMPRDPSFWITFVVALLFSMWLGGQGGNCDYCWVSNENFESVVRFRTLRHLYGPNEWGRWDCDPNAGCR